MGSTNGRRASSSRAAAAVCLLFARPLVADGGRAAEVAAWLTGTFELKDQGSDGAPEAVRIVIVAVPKSRIANGALVLYREQAAAPKLDEPTQQRFYRLEEDGDTVRMRAFDPKDSHPRARQVARPFRSRALRRERRAREARLHDAAQEEGAISGKARRREWTAPRP